MRVFGIIAGAVMAGLISMGGLVHALDVADVAREWTPEGKKSRGRTVKLPAHDEMIRIPAGEFLMGSDKKIGQEFLSGRVPSAEGLSGCV